MHTKLHFGALAALVFALSISGFGSRQARAADPSTPPEGVFLDHDEVVRRGGVGNYLFRNYPGPHKHLGTYMSENEPGQDMANGQIDTDLQQAGIANQAASIDTALDKANSKLYFESNSAKLNNEGREDLGRVGELLANQRAMKIEVDGFADPPGTDEYNLRLSRMRAENVSRALVDRGVPRERIVIKAWGESRQVPDENNRRVEIRRVEG